MRCIITMDAKNYDSSLPVIYRRSARGIVFSGGRILLVHTDFGEVKLPGGGIEAGESDRDALIREILEETGRHVIPQSICEYGEVEEKRLSTGDNAIWHHISRLYTCSLDSREEETSFSENERAHGMFPAWYTLDEAIAINEEMLAREGMKPHNIRDYTILKYIRDSEMTI